jgi:trehalose-6-phosphatase
MKLKYDFVIEEVAGQKIAMVVGDDADKSGFMQLNDTGVYILNLLKEDVTAEYIVANIQKDFDVDNINEVAEWVNAFIKALQEADVLE